MSERPIVSVIIPNYNHARFLKQRIDSVLNQSYQDFELLILDDNSSDNSKEIIEQYAGNSKITHIVYNHENSGNTFRQWKKGLALAQGNYIWIAESDDYADPAFLATLLLPFTFHKDLLISYCQSTIVGEAGEFIRVLDWADALHATKWKSDYMEDAATELRQFLRFRNTIPNASAVIFKKPVDLDVLDASCALRLSGDWLFWRKILQAPGKVAFSAESYNFFRLHGNTTRAATTREKELQRIREFKIMLDRSILRPFDDRYDWMISMWFQNRKVLKGTIHYFIPFLPVTLLFRLSLMYSRHTAKRMRRLIDRLCFPHIDETERSG